MIAFSGPAPSLVMPRRAVYAGGLAFAVAMSQTLSAVRRMSADDVVTASLRGLELGEVVVAPGVEDASLLNAIFSAELAAFNAQSPELASRYRGN
ncbi:hypothetical protein V6W11_25700 [Micromonospora profundi]|uniref:hypothetical protein n=1 Tax=Micromonospora profundi TaxID=1420889 RepID=UPI002FF132D9